MKMKGVILAALLASVTASQAVVIGYEISGLTVGPTGTFPVPAGEPFTGRFFYDTSTPLVGVVGTEVRYGGGGYNRVEFTVGGVTYLSDVNQTVINVGNNTVDDLDRFLVFEQLNNGWGVYIAFQDGAMTALNSTDIPTSLNLEDWTYAAGHLFAEGGSIDLYIHTMTQFDSNSIPDSGATAALLGLGVLGLAVARRHITSPSRPFPLG